VDSVERLDAFDDGLLEVRPDGAAGGGQRDDYVDATVPGLLDRAHHPERDDVLAQLRIDDLAQCVLDLFARGHRFDDGTKANAAPEGTAPAEGGEILHWRRGM